MTWRKWYAQINLTCIYSQICTVHKQQKATFFVTKMEMLCSHKFYRIVWQRWQDDKQLLNPIIDMEVDKNISFPLIRHYYYKQLLPPYITQCQNKFPTCPLAKLIHNAETLTCSCYPTHRLAAIELLIGSRYISATISQLIPLVRIVTPVSHKRYEWQCKKNAGSAMWGRISVFWSVQHKYKTWHIWGVLVCFKAKKLSSIGMI